MTKITLYSDGACSPNPGKGGYGAIVVYENPGSKKEAVEDVHSKGYALTTNNRMELLGVIEPLENLLTPHDVTVVTDSQYVVNAINQGWIEKWQKNKWKTTGKKSVKNKDLWKRLIQLLSKHDIKMQWVRGHSEHLQNERCDQLAVQARSESNLVEDKGYVEVIDTIKNDNNGVQNL